MATGKNGDGVDLSFKSAGDMSAGQYKGVELSANDTVDYPDSPKPCKGVLQNAPNGAGKGASVRVVGHTKIIAGGTLTADQAISMTTSGFFVKCTSGYNPCGFCVKGASSGYPAEAVIIPNFNMAVNSLSADQV